MVVGTIAELWRYPVKSMGGEQLPDAHIDDRALRADRLWAVRDLDLGAVTTARRLPVLLGCSARFVAEPPADAGPGNVVDVVVTFPDGVTVTSTDSERMDAKLSELTRKNVSLVSLPPTSDKGAYRGVRPNNADIRRQFAIEDADDLPDLSMFPLRKLAELALFATPIGIFADAYPLHVLTTASLATMAGHEPNGNFDTRRFRPNVVIDTTAANGLVEQGWLGGILRAPGAAIRVEIPTVRCSMPLREQQHYGLDADPSVVRAVSRHADRCLGVYADVEESGRLRQGDAVSFEPPAARGGLESTVGRLAGRLKRNALRAGNRVLPG
ncbi:MOSC N-terminal beta barrel domain-containing protein [Antrihabitans sp. YC3-6]|uniref:MOSC N-terminal beta barrel domain-containing protein n=1 Tax=Antrihabitans stalagmiti TaxID=2799499 RepID=A0A934U2K8_9NOCA|nr:MOSC N-terminal beta barrel domain-containing protein [Antrihabitans stalagmiti]MBJ8338253.1 MOSC N-terminal beta barrel domain-containing protein [Antrihabitans stalagmiti]